MTNTGQLWTPSGLESLEWVRGTGTTEKGEGYEAQNPTEALALYQDLRETSDRVRLQRVGDSPKYKIIAYRGGDPDDPEPEADVDTHELLANVTHKPLAQNQVLHEELTDAQINFVIAIANAFKLDKAPKVSTYYSKISNSTDPAFVGIEDGDARNLFDQLVQGQTSYVFFEWVYRRTTNISSGGIRTYNGLNVGCIFETTDVLLNIEEIDLPAGFYLPDGEWLKTAPTQTSQYGRRTQLQFEYWLADEWARNLYYLAE